MKKIILLASVVFLSNIVADCASAQMGDLKAVTVENFPRAETDSTIEAYAKKGAFGKLMHARVPTSIDDQKVVRMNRDTLYSFGVFDLEAGPLTVILPDSARRYMMAQILDQDQYTHDIVYAPQSKTYSEASIGTRYLIVIIRTLVDPQNPDDVKEVHTLQNEIKVAQPFAGKLELPHWDPVSQAEIRNALKRLGGHLNGTERMFGAKGDVDPIRYLIGSAIGWGGNPESAAVYLSGKPKDESGSDVESITVKDVPIDGFWSVSVYNEKGFFEKNPSNSYSVNSLTANHNPDGSVTVQFGGCDNTTMNCIPTMPKWNYTVRLYRPRKEILQKEWKFPEPVIVEGIH